MNTWRNWVSDTGYTDVIWDTYTTKWKRGLKFVCPKSRQSAKISFGALALAIAFGLNYTCDNI